KTTEGLQRADQGGGQDDGVQQREAIAPQQYPLRPGQGRDAVRRLPRTAHCPGAHAATSFALSSSAGLPAEAATAWKASASEAGRASRAPSTRSREFA